MQYRCCDVAVTRCPTHQLRVSRQLLAVVGQVVITDGGIGLLVDDVDAGGVSIDEVGQTVHHLHALVLDRSR